MVCSRPVGRPDCARQVHRAGVRHELRRREGSGCFKAQAGPHRVSVLRVSSAVFCFQMEKLYLRCLRAESFRKALIYQKKYLLLLIGGFQDSEQETLSMIAHLGVFPSKADKVTPPRPFTKFRTAVRVVIAISRYLEARPRGRGARVLGSGLRV